MLGQGITVREVDSNVSKHRKLELNAPRDPLGVGSTQRARGVMLENRQVVSRMRSRARWSTSVANFVYRCFYQGHHMS